jgi:hypothetical protein
LYTIAKELFRKNDYFVNNSNTILFPKVKLLFFFYYTHINTSYFCEIMTRPAFLTLFPSEVVQMSIRDVLNVLYNTYGERLELALNDTVPPPSPTHDTSWLRHANTVGINVRTIGHFFNLVPYAITLPTAQNAIHILPVFEPGVVASLYGPCSWQVNPEFYSPQLAVLFPQLNTVEKQLKCTINILHLLGKMVGMDVIPHTDRFSEQVLANPQYFEWLQRRDLAIVRHDDDLLYEVQALIFMFLAQMGSATPHLDLPGNPSDFFEKTPESVRLLALFGAPHDYGGRLQRRKMLIDVLYDSGIETVPATMAPPYRGIEVDPDPGARVVDEEGRIWRDFRITRPEPMSRVFGPLTRYKLFHSKDNNRDWVLDFDRPNTGAWDYVCTHYRQFQAAFGFDFMRGDMSHVQMRPDGVPARPDDYYDLLAAVKKAVLPEKPYFGYFAESFLAPAGHMAFGDECDHLEASLADSTLGDLQSEPVGTEKFVRDFAAYRHWLENRSFAPNFTIMTADKDDPRFDRFYLDGNEIRHFIALFLTDMPSYMGLGFECRDLHPVPAPNEHYTKLYVFHMPDGPKGTKGPYEWGGNRTLYQQLVRQRELSETIGAHIAGADVAWLLRPDPEGQRKTMAWTQAGQAQYIFVVNLDTLKPASAAFDWPAGSWKPVFSTIDTVLPDAGGAVALRPGEGVVFGR